LFGKPCRSSKADRSSNAMARMPGQVERNGFDVGAHKILQRLPQTAFRFDFWLCCGALCDSKANAAD
jgi:hypothetical protein